MNKLDELIAGLATAPAPVTPRAPMRMLWLWLAISFAYLALLVAVSGFRPDILDKIAQPLFTAEIAMLVFIILTTSIAAVFLSFPDMYQSPEFAWPPVALLVGFAVLLFLGWWADVPPAPLPPHGMECLICITLFSLVPATGLFYFLRQQASTHIYAAGAVAVVNAFSIGCLALRLSEETDSVAHLVQWHYLPMVGAAVAGIAAGRVFLKW
ncbi:MAG: DUF1109 domain-containing protein [Rickettsiales bacterium]|nr:DUF1109 domain-containing protein [Rickettsiales bacterium]